MPDFSCVEASATALNSIREFVGNACHATSYVRRKFNALHNVAGIFPLSLDKLAHTENTFWSDRRPFQVDVLKRIHSCGKSFGLGEVIKSLFSSNLETLHTKRAQSLLITLKELNAAHSSNLQQNVAHDSSPVRAKFKMRRLFLVQQKYLYNRFKVL